MQCRILALVVGQMQRTQQGKSTKLLERRMAARQLKLSLKKKGKEGNSKLLRRSRWMIEDIDGFCETLGLRLTCIAEYSGDDV